VLQTFLTVAAAGYAILIGAIVLNLLATSLGLVTWYGFLESAAAHGCSGAIREAGVISIVYLFVLYPLLLGWMAWELMIWIAK
jgi:hypothetical protein